MKSVKRTLSFCLSLFFFLGAAMPALGLETVNASVQRVVCGDTIIAVIEGKEERVRIIGVDTPETAKPGETAEPFGPEALAFTKNALSGKTVRLEMDAAPRDVDRILLAYVWLAPPEGDEPAEIEIRENLFNSILLLGGYAQFMTVPPNVKYDDRFEQFQTEAREHVRGLWSRYCPWQ